MNRTDKLLKRIPSLAAQPELLAQLASLPVPQVDAMCKAATLAGHDRLAADKARRKQRNADRRRYGWDDPEQVAARNLRLVTAAGKTAPGNLDALGALAEFVRHSETIFCEAVNSARRQFDDPTIAAYIGCSPQAIGQRFGRRRDLGLPSTGSGPRTGRNTA